MERELSVIMTNKGRNAGLKIPALGMYLFGNQWDGYAEVRYFTLVVWEKPH